MVKKIKHETQGFTIVELLIATVVFSLVLLLATRAIIQVGKTYSKGISSAQTQNAARSLVDEVSQSIQFSSGGNPQLPGNANFTESINGVIYSVKYFCTMDKRYTYMPHVQLLDGVANQDHVFVSDDNGISKLCPNPTSWPNGPDAVELLQPGMRLANFDVTRSSNYLKLYKIDMRLVYGDDDLLCSPTARDCNSNVKSTNLGSTDLACKSRAGTQFCGVSKITTSVEQRL